MNGFESCRDWKGLVGFITAYRYKTEDQTNHKWDDLNYYAISNSSWKFLSKSPCLPIRERFERSIVNVRKKLFLSSIFPSNSFGEISIVKISKRRLDKRNTSKSTIEFPCLDIRHSEWPGLLWNFQCNFYRFIDVSTRSVNLITLSVFFNFSIFFLIECLIVAEIRWEIMQENCIDDRWFFCKWLIYFVEIIESELRLYSKQLIQNFNK